MLSPQGIRKGDVDLGTVKSAIPGVQGPFEAGLVQGLFHHFLGLVPDLDVAQETFGSGRQFESVSKSKSGINMFQKVQSASDLILDLIRQAENMGVILLKTPNSGQTRQGSGELIPMQDSEICHS